MPAPLARIFHALHSLPAVDAVSEVQLQLGPWCASAPLIGNPWLRDACGMVLGRDSSGDMVELLWCHTVGGLAHLLHFLHIATDHQWQQSPWSVIPRQLAAQHVLRWIQFVPSAWLARGWSAPTQPHPPGHSSTSTVHTQIERLGWKVPNEDGGSELAVVPRASLSVRMAYRMLMQPVVQTRVERWRTFIADALGVDVAEVDNIHMHSLHRLLAVIWRRVKWGNNRKVLSLADVCYWFADSHLPQYRPSMLL
jgi:hypothetical protein